MTNTSDRVKGWPRNKKGELVFKNTHEAIFYANLITDKKRLVDEIDVCLRSARRELSIYRTKKSPNLDRLMHLAVKAQFFRECLQEVNRIKDEQPKKEK